MKSRAKTLSSLLVVFVILLPVTAVPVGVAIGAIELSDQPSLLTRLQGSGKSEIPQWEKNPPIRSDNKSMKYRAMFTLHNGKPARWCAETIGYRIDFRGYNQEAQRAEWREAFDQWTKASNGRYTFEYRGPANIAPSIGGKLIDKSEIPEGEIAIKYEKTIPSGTNLANREVYGIGGAHVPQWGETYSKGSVVINTAAVNSAPYALRKRVIVHEAGHALGLKHVPDRQSLMHPGITSVTSPGLGDSKGIRWLHSYCD